MRVVITGGGGFLGQVLAKEILEKGSLRSSNKEDEPVSEIVIGDVVEVKKWLFESLSSAGNCKVRSVIGDVRDEGYCKSLLGDGAESGGGLCVFHLGAVMSGAGEKDFDLAMNVNLRGTMNMLESARHWHSSTGVKPIFIYASAGATVGSGCDTDWITADDVISDGTRAAPHTTYGMTKACGELLLSDYHRRGFVDGRGVRLPTVIVRAGAPNAATTGCFSSIIREPLSGADVAPLPLAPDLNHALTSYTAAVQGMIAFQTASPDLADRVLGPYDRTAFLPSKAVSLASLATALKQLVHVDSHSLLGDITYQHDQFLSSVIGSFPTNIDSSRALALGAPPTPDIHTIIRQYCQDFPHAIHPDIKLNPSPHSTNQKPNYLDEPNLIVGLITGAGSGIGRATAIKLSKGGWGRPTGKGFTPNTTYGLVLVGRRIEPLRQTEQLCIQAAQKDNPNITLRTLVLSVDVTCEKEVTTMFDTISATFGRLDLLFNNAGTNVSPSPFPDVSLQDFSKVIEANLHSTFLCSKYAIKLMDSPYCSPTTTENNNTRKGGRIINNGSISATSPRPGAAPYTASKHAVLGLTKSIALDGRKYNVSCGQIDFGNVTSDVLDTAVKGGGMMQADGSKMMEPTMNGESAADAVFAMASLPPGANVLQMTVMATNMPFVGRG